MSTAKFHLKKGSDKTALQNPAGKYRGWNKRKIAYIKSKLGTLSKTIALHHQIWGGEIQDILIEHELFSRLVSIHSLNLLLTPSVSQWSSTTYRFLAWIIFLTANVLLHASQRTLSVILKDFKAMERKRKKNIMFHFFHGNNVAKITLLPRTFRGRQLYNFYRGKKNWESSLLYHPQ